MLETKNLSKSYGNKQVLKDISLTFVEGEIVFVVGKSGCGKTTLLNILGGLDGCVGTIVFGGKATDLNQHPIKYQKDEIGIVFQDFNLIGGLTVAQNIAIAKREYDPEWIDTNVNQLGLESSQKARQLSGGESQRLALLRALYKDAKVVLADEPTGNLDSENTEIVFEYFGKLREQGKIVIIVSHDIESAERYGDRIIRLQDGVVVSDQRQPKVVDDAKLQTDLDKDIADEVVQHPNSTNSNTSVDKDATIATQSPKRIWADGLLTLNSAKTHLFRTGSLVLIVAIAITMTAMLVSFVDMNAKQNAVISQIDALDVLDVNSANFLMIDDPETEIDESVVGKIDEDVLDRLAELDNVNKIVPIPWSKQQLLLLDGQDYDADTAKNPNNIVNVINVDSSDWMRDRMMSRDVQGSWIASKDEIVIDRLMADSIFGKGVDPIGTTVDAYQVVDIYTGYSRSIKVTIVGVTNRKHKLDYNHANNPTYYSYVSWELMRDIHYSEALSNKNPYRIELYLKDPTKYRQLPNSFGKDFDTYFEVYESDGSSRLNKAIVGFNQDAKTHMPTIAVLTGLIVVIVLVVVCIFVKLGTVDRLREIVVLRSLGFGAWRILGLFVLENLLAIGLAIVPTIVFNLILRGVMTHSIGFLAPMFFGRVVDNIMSIVGIFGMCFVIILLLTRGVVFKKVAVLLKKAKT
jgi:ABC-type lipoprotein export system ATPase subunit/ABC-type antimicrobial peptide transport system permease subunit